MQELLTPAPLVLRNLDKQSSLQTRVQVFLVEESTENAAFACDAERTIEQVQNVPEFAPVRVLRSGKWPDEKSTERVGQHLQEIEAKVARIHKAISQRLAFLQGSDDFFLTDSSFGVCAASDSGMSPSPYSEKPQESRSGEEESRWSPRLFTPVGVPDSPGLSAVEKVPEAMDDWDGSFLDAPTPPRGCEEQERTMEAFGTHAKPGEHARVAKHSGDDEGISLSNISVHPFTHSDRDSPALSSPTAVTPSSRRVWKCFFCRCFRGSRTAVDSE